MKVRFIAAFDYVPQRFKGRVRVAYPAGYTGTVKRECGEQAVAAGKAESLEPSPPAPAAALETAPPVPPAASSDDPGAA